MSKMMIAHATSHEKVYMVKSLEKIENRTEFFELISKTGTIVSCTSNGLNVDNNIHIAPEAYNQIGTAVIKDKLVQIKKYNTTAWAKIIIKEFSKNLPSAKGSKFNERLRPIMELPFDKRKQAIKEVLREINGDKSVKGDLFDKAWEKIKRDAENDVDKQITKMIKNMKGDFENLSERKAFKIRIQELQVKLNDKTITMEEEQELQRRLQELENRNNFEVERERDFDELKRLCKKKVSDEITYTEEENLATQIKKCARHRKEHFFKSSADHRVGQPERTNDEAFKADIKTFSNGQNERLCYHIDMEHVKSELTAVFHFKRIEDITVGGQNIFSKMKIKDYDRLHRVLNECGKNSHDLLKAAVNIANDDDFAGEVKTPDDLASVIEAIKTDMVLFLPNIFKVLFCLFQGSLPVNKRADHLKNLVEGNGVYYESFRNKFNGRIDAVYRLNDGIRSQWSSALSMAYHAWKHERDFDGVCAEQVTIDIYFEELVDHLFKITNLSIQSYTQSGMVRHTYMRSVYRCIHVGFTVGPNKIRASLFPKSDPF